jgi:hypothetical protein
MQCVRLGGSSIDRLPMTAVTRYARSGDVFIAYQVTGEGPLPMVLAPGTVSHLDLDWEFPLRADFFTRLSSLFRLVRFDRYGRAAASPSAAAAYEDECRDRYSSDPRRNQGADARHEPRDPVAPCEGARDVRSRSRPP